MDHIDLYCERLDSSLLSEPINAMTNGAFIAAGLVLSCKAKQTNWKGNALIILVFLIGIGSLFFHTFATGWARVLDVVPILMFQLLFVWTYLREIAKWSMLSVSIFVALFLCLVLFLRCFPQTWNGSLTYIPAITLLFGFSFFQYINHLPGAGILLLASVLFTTSLIFRSIDDSICSYLEVGTHFLWHLFNSLVLYLCVSCLLIKRG
ncbi:ceramidase domain-containing protein [Vibrio maritimus]|uniref:ceramidase domain-containing protein n=1 Tax=Vibrio maritimus TaxID=990268 RepID=UPI0037362192